jgi:hypothetical protein
VSETLKIWEAVRTPPKDALKEIKGRRFRGTDIDPMWRIFAMTQQFGPCGDRWGFEITGDEIIGPLDPSGQVLHVASVEVWYPGENGDRVTVPGRGATYLVAKESGGLYLDDEAHKKSVTDALGFALKHLGVAADVYMGRLEGSKYQGLERGATDQQVAQRRDEVLKEVYGASLHATTMKRVSAIVGLDEREQKRMIWHTLTGTVAADYKVGETLDREADVYELKKRLAAEIDRLCEADEDRSHVEVSPEAEQVGAVS